MKKKNVLLALVLIPFFAISQTGNINSNENYIAVRGEAIIHIVPERIELTISFTETENIKKENELKEKEQKMIALLKSLSIDIKDLDIDNFTASRNSYLSSSSKKVFVSKIYKLNVYKAELVDTLTLKLFEIGADDIYVSNLYSSKLEEKKMEAVKIASQKAKQKAQLIATSLECSVGKPIQINEQILVPERSFKMDGYLYQDKFAMANMSDNYENEGIGIKKIRINYILDVKFEIQ